MNPNATSKNQNQAGHPRKNRFEAGPAQRKINRGHSQRVTNQQPNASTRNQSSANGWQSRQSSIINVDRKKRSFSLLIPLFTELSFRARKA